MIKPTVGRVVWYHPAADSRVPHSKEQPLAAIICFVHSDSMVNLSVFDSNGGQSQRTSVHLVQEGEDAAVDAEWCMWMPYQKGQAAKTEDVTAKLAERVTALEGGFQVMRAEQAEHTHVLNDFEPMADTSSPTVAETPIAQATGQGPDGQ
jgi:RecB family endonuclease NucS